MREGGYAALSHQRSAISGQLLQQRREDPFDFRRRSGQIRTLPTHPLTVFNEI